MRYTGDIAHAVNFSEVMKGANLYVEKMKKAMISQPMADKTDEEIFYQDFKRFTAGKVSFAVGQISSLNEQEIESLKERLLSYITEAHKHQQGVDMMFFMLTNILDESTMLICEGTGAKKMILSAFHIEDDGKDGRSSVVKLPGVVSRKKQLIPAIGMALQA